MVAPSRGDQMLVTKHDTFAEICNAFQWSMPDVYNLAHDVCDRHAAQRPDSIALIQETQDGVRNFTYRDIQRYANQTANYLKSIGLQRGDRVMILLGQDPATAIMHVACWKAGLISTPTSVLFGAEAIAYRLQDAGVRALITNTASYARVMEAREQAPTLQAIMLTDGAGPGASDYWGEIARASDAFDTLPLTPDTPALISYTSGTTGLPKGTLHAHRVLLGHMPSMEVALDFFPQPDDIMWSPADWSWLAGLMNVLMASWFVGIPVLTFRATSFDPEQAMDLMGRHHVRTSILTPTVLKLLRQAPRATLGKAKLRSILSGSEAVGKDLLEWSSGALGVRVNEAFGQTECNVPMGNSWRVLEARPGSLGKAMPGHTAAIVDDEGNVLKPGKRGNLAFRRGHPVMFLEYWNQPEATAAKYAGDWLLTGDLAYIDDDGYYWYQGRGDDVITSSGYRIGPGEIEDALIRHPAVAMAAVIGVPDPVRTESIKAFIVLARGVTGSDALADDIREMVRSRLARHEYPREIAFVDALPMTVTGKILRRELREQERQRRMAQRPDTARLTR